MRDKVIHVILVVINYIILYRIFEQFSQLFYNHEGVYDVLILLGPLVIVLPLALIIAAKLIEQIKQSLS